MKVKELIEKLQKNYDAEESIACILWSSDDVYDRAIDNEQEISREEATAIIETVEAEKDCAYGISWDAIEEATEDFIEDKDK